MSSPIAVVAMRAPVKRATGFLEKSILLVRFGTQFENENYERVSGRPRVEEE